MFKRDTHLEHLRTLLTEFPVVGLIGARQVGKTTLARQLAATIEGPVTHFDLESSRDLGRLQDPLFALEGLEGLVILDEVQLRPAALSASPRRPWWVTSTHSAQPSWRGG